MSIWKHYLTPQSLKLAIECLSNSPGEPRLIAGGTDLLLEIGQGHLPPVDTLVDINQVPEMKCLEVREDTLFIGAAVPLSHITGSKLVIEHAQALAEAAGLVGGPQVRNSATLGGNVAHALPAADGTISLVALNTQVEIANLDGVKRLPILEVFLGPGKSSLDPHRDILVGFYISLKKKGQASAFSRVMRPQGVALPILNASIWLERSWDRIVDIRIAYGPSGPIPKRATAVEEVLKNQPFNAKTLEMAYRQLVETVKFRTSPRRASSEYRLHLSQVLFEEVFEKAWQRAWKDQEA
jgi:carbon-monoxide dehydrogenase medium subunit